jgi:lysine biosynthesis protein LysW
MPNPRIMALTAECPECNAIVTFEKMPRLGQTTVCASCQTELEVAYLYPIMLDWVDYNAPQKYEEDDDTY